MSNENGILIADGPAQVNDFRNRMIKMGLEAEMRGMRLTGRAPRCFKLIEMEHGIKVKKRDKYAAYLKYCELMGFEPKPQPAKIA